MGHVKLKVAGLIVVVLGIAAWVWWRGTNTVPVITIPTPKMPVPNARGYYVAAGKALRDVNEIGFAIEKAKPSYHVNSLDRFYPLAEKDALLKDNAQVLKTLRQGFAYEYRVPPIRRSPGTLRTSPAFGSCRGCSFWRGNRGRAMGIREGRWTASLTWYAWERISHAAAKYCTCW